MQEDRRVWVLASVGAVLLLMLLGIAGSWSHFVSIFLGLEDTFGLVGKVVLITIALAVPTCVLLGIAVLGIRMYWMLFRSIKPSEQGNYEALVDVRGRVITIEAGNGPVPHSYNYRYESQTMRELPAPRVRVEEEEDEQGYAPALPIAPPFSRVLPLVRPDRLVLCYTGQQTPVYGTVDDLLSTNVNGKPGRGKTSLLYFIIAQLLISQAEITVFDPHGSMKELEGVFTYLDNYESMSEYVPVMERMLQERLVAWKARCPQDQPHLLVVDEAPAIAAWEKKQEHLYKTRQRPIPHNSILQLIQTIILEARKLKVYVIVAGQSMPATVLPTLARDNLSSHYVFFSSNGHAKMAGLEKDDIEELLPRLKSAGPGVCVFDAVRRSEAEIGAIPLTTLDDLLQLAPAMPTRSEEDEEWFPDEETAPMFSPHAPQKTYFEQTEHFSTGELVRDVRPLDNLRETVRETQVSVTEQERVTIKAAARAQLAATGKEKVNRSQLLESQGWNNRMWPKVKYVLDQEGL